jgi:hypothetical protein
VDSTIRRILKYTSEILISIILLILISLPLVFTVPMWVQEIVLGVPSENLAVNPIAWFGAFTTFVITIGLGMLSFILGYLFLYRFIPSREVPPQETKESEESETDEEETEDSVESLETELLPSLEESDES